MPGPLLTLGAIATVRQLLPRVEPRPVVVVVMAAAAPKLALAPAHGSGSVGGGAGVGAGEVAASEGAGPRSPPCLRVPVEQIEQLEVEAVM